MLKHQAISTRNVDLVFIVLPIFIQKYYIYCEQYKKMKLHFWKKKKFNRSRVNAKEKKSA